MDNETPQKSVEIDPTATSPRKRAREMVVKKTVNAKKDIASDKKTATATAVAKPVVLVKSTGVSMFGHLNQKQANTRRKKTIEDNVKMRQHLWPNLKEGQLWLRTDKTRKGFTTMPRTMPLFVNLINDISKRVTDGKSVPAGRSYLVLWCRVFDEGFLKIESEAAAALEAGYSGERNVTTWREHLSILKELGFIDCMEGPSGPFQYIVIFNPYKAVNGLNAKGWVQKSTYTALFQRAMDIGATDLNES